MVQGAVVGKLNNLNNPFIKLLDANNSKQIIDEQRKSDMVGGNLEIGKLLTAKAILSGEVTVLQISEGNIYKTEKKGYLREETKTKDPKTGEVKVNVSYQKTIYYTYEQENKVSIAFKFQLTSTETGAVMVSDYFLSSKSDYIEYATFNGPGEKLVPGYWEKKDSKSSNDVVYDDITNVNKLHRLLNARRQITSINSLINDAVDELAMQAVKKINYYNPEK